MKGWWVIDDEDRVDAQLEDHIRRATAYTKAPNDDVVLFVVAARGRTDSNRASQVRPQLLRLVARTALRLTSDGGVLVNIPLRQGFASGLWPGRNPDPRCGACGWYLPASHQILNSPSGYQEPSPTSLAPHMWTCTSTRIRSTITSISVLRTLTTARRTSTQLRSSAIPVERRRITRLPLCPCSSHPTTQTPTVTSSTMLRQLTPGSKDPAELGPGAPQTAATAGEPQTDIDGFAGRRQHPATQFCISARTNTGSERLARWC